MTESSAPSATGEAHPLASPVADEFVIVDAPMPDHTASDDDELSQRSPERTARLLGAAKARTNKSRAERPKREKKPTPPMPRGGFVKPLTEMYGTVALALMPFDYECAMAVMEAAPKCAESLDALAKNNPAIRRILIALTNTTAVGAVLAAHLPIVVAVTVHHVPAVRDSEMGGMMKALMSSRNNAAEADAA